MRRLGIAISAVTVLMLGLLTPLATADAVYHSQQIALAPVGTSPLQSGFVENIHANGPNVYAHELYILAGAAPTTTYAVTLHLFSDTGCTDEIATIPTATFQTNSHGNGVGQAEFTPDLGAWYHLAVVRTNTTIEIYVNGVSVGSDALDFEIPNPDAPLTIGQAEGIGFVNGLIDAEAVD